jgi:hypothetical protein
MLNRALITLCLLFISQIEMFAQVLGVPLYSWDFASGLPATWSNGSNSNIGVWEYRGPNTVPSNAITSRGSCAGGSSAFNSVTQSNGFMIFDSNYWDDNDNQCGGFGTGPDPGPHTAWLISNSFSLTGVTGAVVTYQQQFRNYSSTIKVQYSINGGTSWIDMITQSDFPSATAEWKSATFPAGAIGQTNVRLRFLYSGSYYHWAIDDITVYKPSINNLSINSTRYTTFGNTSPVPPNDFHDLPYDRYPKTMLVPFKFNAKATNIGSATQTSTNLNVKVLNSSNTVLYNQTTANSNVAAGATGNYTLATGFTPSVTTGYFRIAYQINQSQTDEAPNNNRDTLDYFITDYQYARDEGPMEDEFTPSALYAGQTYQVGNIFQGRSNTVKCTSVAVAVGPGTAIGTTIRARIYRTDFTNLQATSVEYPVNAWDVNTIGQQKLITLQLPTPLTLMNDSVYIVMVENTVGTQAFKVCRSGAAIDQTSFVRYPENNGFFFMAKMPVVRMNLFTAAQTPGCTNPLANNYLATANIDDGSCDIPGCIYPSSSNYNPNATWYDGSCVVSGCTIPTACNYSPIATVNDGSCVLPITYYADTDADSFGNAGSPLSACSPPIGYVLNSQDCNDNNANVNINATEICNTFDDDCDGLINEGLAITTYYLDNDGDGFGNPSISQNSCTPLSGYVTNNTDCNDSNAQVKPGATEICNLIDDNCNGQINEGLIFVNYYIDSDLDGYGAGTATNSCTPIFGNYVTNNLDCNNNNANIRPNASEVCNSIDDNCNILIDEGLQFINYYLDTDGDGFGAGTALNSCSNPGSSYSTSNTDCNNNNPNISPNAIEICNGIDDNCNTLVDDGLSFTTFYLDDDHDGYYLSTLTACISPGSSYTSNGIVLGDCNNFDPNINAGASEICGNAIDENCDGQDFACIVLGCTNTIATNYNPLANQEDGSCIILGCTDPNADNFNSAANTPDGSCIYLGCTDPFANNFNPTANTNDFSCEYNDAAISVEDSTICQFDSILLYNQTLFSSDDSCVIDFGDGTIENYCSPFYVHLYNQPGTYTIQFTYFQGDTSSFANKVVTVKSLPDSSWLSFEFPQITLNYNISDTFEWYFNGELSAIAEPSFNASLDYGTDGFYRAKVRNEAGCEIMTDSIYFVIPTYSYTQTTPCGPSELIFENTTLATQTIQCHFENANSPGNIFEAPYSYILNEGENISILEVCSAFGNTYYSLNNPNVQSYPIPSAPTLSFNSNIIEVLNYNGNDVTWILNNSALSGNVNSSSLNTLSNSIVQNGNYSAFYTNEFGCESELASIFVLELNASVTNNQGCYPLSTSIINNTSMPDGISCEILIPGSDFVAIQSSYNFTLSDPGIYEPILYCYSGIYSSTLTLEPITVFEHPSEPNIDWSFGEVHVTNNSYENVVAWQLDGNDLSVSTDSISTFINGIYENGYYSATFTNAQGCSTSSDAVVVIQPQFEVISGAGCGPFNAVLVNTTDPIFGMTCTINDGLGGANMPFLTSTQFTYSETGSYSPEVTCQVGNNFGSFSDSIITVYPNPSPSELSYLDGTITAINVPATTSIEWMLNGTSMNIDSNPLVLSNGNLSGYFFGILTNEFGCISSTDTLLQIFPSYTLSTSEGCGPLNVQASNTTPFFEGMSCVLTTNNNTYNFNNSTIINYNTDGEFTTSIACTLDGQTFISNGASVTVHPNAPTPLLSSAYGAVLCSNCSGLFTQYFLDNVAFAQGTSSISTLQGGVYQNGYYTAQAISGQGCLSEISNPLLVIQPTLSFSPSEGCAPLFVTFVNNTDEVEGISCELFLGNGNGNIPLSYLESYDFNYTIANTYNPYLTCTLANVVANSPNTTLTINGGTIPSLIFENGFVTCTNCSNQDNTYWTIDGNLTLDSLVSVSDTLGEFFSCSYFNEYGCSANAFIVSVAEANQESFSIFPNPAQDFIQINGLRVSSTIEIHDTQGRLLLKEKGIGTSRKLNTLNLSNGLYTIIEISQNSIRSGTLLVNH